MDRRRQCQDPYQIMRESLREEAPPSSSRGYGSQDSSNPRRQRRSQGQATSHQRNCYAQGGAVTMVMNTAGKMVPQSSQPYAHGGKVQRRQEQADMDSHSPFSRQHASERTKQRGLEDQGRGGNSHELPSIAKKARGGTVAKMAEGEFWPTYEPKFGKNLPQQYRQHNPLPTIPEESHVAPKIKRHLDNFNYEKYPSQVSGACAAHTACRYDDYLKDNKGSKDRIQNEINPDMPMNWNIQKNRHATLKNNKIPLQEEGSIIKNFVDEANNNPRYKKPAPLLQIPILSADPYLKDINYGVDTHRGQTLPEKIKYLQDTLDNGLPIAAGGQMQYPGQPAGQHNFLITGIKEHDPEYRKLKNERNSLKLDVHQLISKGVMSPDANKLLKDSDFLSREDFLKLRDKVAKYEATKNHPHKVYYADSNFKKQQKAYIDEQGNASRWNPTSKTLNSAFSLKKSENKGALSHLSDTSLSHVTGYTNKTGKRVKFPYTKDEY